MALKVKRTTPVVPKEPTAEEKIAQLEKEKAELEERMETRQAQLSKDFEEFMNYFFETQGGAV